MICLHNSLGGAIEHDITQVQSLDYAMNQPVVMEWEIVCHRGRHNDRHCM